MAGVIAGSFFDFKGIGTSGNVRELGWAARFVLDRRERVTSSLEIYAGVGYEYGEFRSWLENLRVSDEGPRNRSHGGLLRLGAAFELSDPLEATVELSGSAYHGHAVDAGLGADYNWIGRSLGMVAGVSYRLR